jgi:EpsD family peptidyl-prolyl cis-trans isomerase
MLVAGCGGPKDKPASQTAAKVNKEEITVHQINAVLAQQRGVSADQADQAARGVLERLVDQELAVQKAAELKLDREPKVVQAIETARRDIIARAYAERMGEGASKPTPEEIRKYFNDNAALFRERRIYQLQEIAIQAEPGQVESLRTKLKASKGVNEFVDYLKANGLKFSGNQAVRAAEQVPLAMLPALAAMKDGQMTINPTAAGANVLVLVSSRAQPVDEARATRAIEQFLANERKRRTVADDLKALRVSAKIEYIGSYAGGAPTAAQPKAPTPSDVAASAVGAAGAAATTLAEPDVKAASGVDTATINKGLGWK